jgi:hypothetical protein
MTAMNRSQQLGNYYSILRTTRVLLLEANKLKEDLVTGDFSENGFYTNKVPMPEYRLNILTNKTHYYLGYLAGSKITTLYHLGPGIDSVKTLVQDYNRAYNELIYLYELKGL